MIKGDEIFAENELCIVKPDGTVLYNWPLIEQAAARWKRPETVALTTSLEPASELDSHLLCFYFAKVLLSLKPNM